MDSIPNTSKCERQINKKSREWHFLEEKDSTVQTCKVYLQMEPPNQTCAKLPTFLVSDSLRHWSILCVFGDRKIKYDLFNSGGGLTPGEIWPKWREINKPHKTIPLGIMKTSPSKINELAKNHEMNGGKFHATERNCQLWALHLLKLLHQDLYIMARISKARPLKERKFALVVRNCVYLSNLTQKNW